MSGMNKIGISAATSAAVIEITVNAIWRTPAIAACKAVSPSSIRRMMFSIMMIASSTTKPVAMVSAIRLRLSRL